jgi:DNA-directed RNA polymerase specialized sigma24 family protein
VTFRGEIRTVKVQDEPMNFTDLYRRYAREVYRFALCLAADRATAKSYFSRIARNLHADNTRRSAQQGKMPDDAESLSAGAERSMQQKERLGANDGGAQANAL